MNPLHMPLPMSTTYMQVEVNDRFAFVVPPSKKNQAPIIFGRVRHLITTSNDSDEDLKPTILSLCTVSIPYMKEIGYDMRRGEVLNFGKGRRISLQPFVSKGKPT